MNTTIGTTSGRPLMGDDSRDKSLDHLIERMISAQQAINGGNNLLHIANLSLKETTYLGNMNINTNKRCCCWDRKRHHDH